ncbi:hypothetical protein [Nocardia seriolae]|uniref:Uncharacterized protein n=1 Tax=Nocardia seriolae TaxID=37332 RepID=A0ABC8AQX7_9NOCA|nr:hypothetical protein [Nocardia seriolae]APA96551.1 hypothetical protein NS506_02487 [Nocardia seriolae]MTJ61618.1 hypothetical protein [Nocardia seriolae]MTJ71585.1 hypothetical protein [Nocardia seriolae]MTJ86638.1 hypothetical protein [Nocardia seriolae]MTK30633.1 hypothetical protein [Nocardia seriolae]
MSSIKTTDPLLVPVLMSLLRNGIVHRAMALAIATVVLIGVHQPTWVPYAVTVYAIWNAAAVTLNSARAARAAAR